MSKIEPNLFLEGAETINSKPIQWPKPSASPELTAQAINNLIDRVLDHSPAAQLFQIQINPQLTVNDKEVFQLSNGSLAGTVMINASSGVAAAMGFNYYLKYVADSSCKFL